MTTAALGLSPIHLSPDGSRHAALRFQGIAVTIDFCAYRRIPDEKGTGVFGCGHRPPYELRLRRIVDVSGFVHGERHLVAFVAADLFVPCRVLQVLAVSAYSNQRLVLLST